MRPATPIIPSAPIQIGAAPSAAGGWEEVAPLLAGTRVGKVWNGWALTPEEEAQLRRIHAQHPMGQPDFDTWLRTTLKEAFDAFDARRRSRRLPEPTPAAPRELVGARR